MEALVKGTIVVLPFPFSDLSASKKRPALVIATLKGNDVILCQITSKARFDDYSIPLTYKDFSKGALNVPSMIRPNRLFTADKSIILYKIGSLRKDKVLEVENAIVSMVKN